MDSKLKLIVDSFGEDKFKLNEPAANFTALKVGGPVKLFFIAFTQHEIIRLIKFCRELKVPFLIIGTGSKMMISDQGFDGLVIKNRTRNIKISSIKGKVSKGGVGVDEVTVEVDSGVGMDSFADFLKNQGLFYEEFLGLPGSIGGNLFVNPGLQNKVEHIKVIDQIGEVEIKDYLHLSLNSHIILSATFKIRAS